MKKHIDLRPTGIQYKLDMRFNLFSVLFSRHLLVLIHFIITSHKAAKRLGLIPRTKIIFILATLEVKIEIIILEPSGIDRKKLKTFVRFFNPPKATEALYSGHTANGSHF
jgi:hypothetical protein